jgi:predicted ATPase
MKLRRIEIENYRGFADPLEIEIEDFTAFIGQNDIGKSTVLAALNLFLEGEGAKIDSGDGCKRGDSSKVRITCEFDQLPDTVVLDDQFETTLAAEQLLCSNGRLRITKIYDCTKANPKASVLLNAENHPVGGDGESLLTLTLTELKNLAKAHGIELEKGEATVKAKIRKALVERSNAFTLANVQITLSKNDSETLWKQLIKRLPMCALFISDRASSDQDSEAQTPMGLAVKTALSEVEEKLAELSAHIEKHVQDVATRTLAKLSEMNEDLASELSVRLKATPKWDSLFKYTLSSDEDIPMDKRGSGVRRLLLLNFFRAEAERRASDAGHRPVIYAIEEPETAQHPNHQKMLVRALIEIADKGGQVVITTHAPGLAGEVPVTGLRFIDKDENGRRTVRSSATEPAHQLYSDLGERLGMLPDNHIRVMVCVEGPGDVRFLKHVSHTLHQNDSSLPDLSCDPRFVMIPMKGGNLRDVVDLHLLRNFKKPEFHLYDRDEFGTYAEEVEKINARNDGSCATQTSKRYMESYIHSEALARATGVKIDIDDDRDFLPEIFQWLGGKGKVKWLLSEDVPQSMTVAEIDERDGSGEIRGWLASLAQMAGA